MFWNMGNMGGEGWTALGFGMHGIGMLLFWGLLIWVTVALVRGIGGATRQSERHEASALETLALRYAKGELSQVEYEQMRQVLAGK